MKRAACVFIALILLTACSAEKNTTENISTDKQYIVGVWISCYELYSMLESGDFKNRFSAATNNMASINVTDAFVHVRAFGDSLFASEYYPQNERTLKFDFDVLEFMIDELLEHSIRFHAWINPFRTADGSFNNPADESVKRNIICGIREILGKYKVSGIHFDDYFYPNPDDTIDAETYSSYSAAGQNTYSIAEYRTAVITDFVFSAKNAIKHINPDVIFSISPAADMEKNKTEAFADVPYWCQNHAVDWIIPQLYFGFSYPNDKFKFENLIKEWRSIPRAEEVKMIIGLPSYKLGTDNEPDNAEWKDGKDILAKQVKMCKNFNDISGVSFFSYSSLFCEDQLHTEALKAVQDTLK